MGVTRVSTEITRHGRDVHSVFDLLGRDENDLTAALAFTLSRSPRLLDALRQRLLPACTSTLSVHLEVRQSAAGRTDLELSGDRHLAVIEAKRGWLLPGQSQLALYAPRIHAVGSGTLSTLSSADATWAAHCLPTQVAGIPVTHLSWDDVRADLADATRSTRGHERTWLDEFTTYLARTVKVRDVADSWTYCVSVSARAVGGGSQTARSFVENGFYFHPYGINGWPARPPNFIAFRWHGKVQRVHRVEKAAVVPTLSHRWASIPTTPETAMPHVVYELGPRVSFTPIPNGAQYRASRLWVLLDQLLTRPTLADALANTRALNT